MDLEFWHKSPRPAIWGEPGYRMKTSGRKGPAKKKAAGCGARLAMWKSGVDGRHLEIWM